MLIKINIHSVVDVITNSSTTIFTYCDGCIGPAKELINEFIKTFGGEDLKGLTADDMFSFGIFCDRDIYVEKYDDSFLEDEDNPFDGVDDHYEFVDDLIERILKGDFKKPNWMIDMEESEDYDGYRSSSNIFIVSKDKKYNKIGKLLISFLHSTYEDGNYNG